MNDSKKCSDQVLVYIRETCSLYLWDAGAISVNLDTPFRLVSGNYSPIYINCRRMISNPTFMQLFTGFAKAICDNHTVTAEVIAGGETAGIPFAAYLAHCLSKVMVYVRKRKKGHGFDNLVEGILPDGAKVLLVEDLITDAGSKLHFVEAIGAAGGVVDDILVLFDRQQGGKEALDRQGIRLHTITDLETTLSVGTKSGFLTEEELSSVVEYLNDSQEWHRNRNLPYVGDN